MTKGFSGTGVKDTNGRPPTIRVRGDDRVQIPLHLFSPENHGGKSLVHVIVGKALEEPDQSKQSATTTGLIPRPADFLQILMLRHANVHHSAALNTKCAALTGLGFKGEEAYEKLDDLTEEGIQAVIDDATEDFCQTGNGMLEVVRRGTKITGIHHLPVQNVGIWKESRNNHNYHYVVTESALTGLMDDGMRRFARFGDLERTLAWLKANGKSVEGVSEVIHFRQSTSLSRYWGLADWLASIPVISMVQAEQQVLYDLFNNGGMADAIVSFLNDEMDPGDWNRAVEVLTGGTGRGNKRKTLVLNLPQPNMKVQVDRLATDFSSPAAIDLDRNMALDLMSAHGVPPTIASVAMGSKIGNNREYKDQVNLFQLLNIGPKQNKFVRTLERTLGKEIDLPKIPRVKQEVPGISPSKSSEMESGWTFKRITEEVNMSDAESTLEAKQNGAMGGNPKQGPQPAQ